MVYDGKIGIRLLNCTKAGLIRLLEALPAGERCNKKDVKWEEAVRKSRGRCPPLLFWVICAAQQKSQFAVHPLFPHDEPMSTLKPTRKVSRRHELREDTVTTFYAHALNFYEKNGRVVHLALVGLVAVIVLILGYNWYQSNQNEKALAEMAFAVDRYEDGAYRAALDGDITFTGLIEIADSYGATSAGNLARFYAADAFFRLGDYENALSYFRSYDKSSDYLGASALAGEAAILEEQGAYEEAGDLFRRAANLFPSEITSPEYLTDAARAYERAGEIVDAESALQDIQEDWPDSQAARNIEYDLSRLAAQK